MRYLRMFSKFVVVMGSSCWGINSKLSNILFWDRLRSGLQNTYTNELTCFHIKVQKAQYDPWHFLVCLAVVLTSVAALSLWWLQCFPTQQFFLLSQGQHSPVDSNIHQTHRTTSDPQAPHTGPACCTHTHTHKPFLTEVNSHVLCRKLAKHASLKELKVIPTADCFSAC